LPRQKSFAWQRAPEGFRRTPKSGTWLQMDEDGNGVADIATVLPDR
jgi:hypothetical protein